MIALEKAADLSYQLSKQKLISYVRKSVNGFFVEKILAFEYFIEQVNTNIWTLAHLFLIPQRQ